MRFNSQTLTLTVLATLTFASAVYAQDSVSSGNWSDASTWSGGTVPQAGGSVTIASVQTVILDVSLPPLQR